MTTTTTPSMFYRPDDWTPGPMEKTGSKAVSYANEQRVLAAIIFMGGYVTGDPRNNTVVRKVKRYAAGDLSEPTVSRAIRQLELKNVLVVDTPYRPGNPGGFITAVATADSTTKAADWAMDDLRRIVMSRKKQAEAEKAATPPKDYVPQLRANQAATKPAPTPDEPISEPEPVHHYTHVVEHGTEVDYGKLADELLVKVMSATTVPDDYERVVAELKATQDKLAETRTRLTDLQNQPKPTKKQWEEAKQVAYNLERENGALKAQITQMEQNLKAVVDGAKDLQERLDRAEARLRRENKDKTRSERLRQRIGDGRNGEELKKLEAK